MKEEWLFQGAIVPIDAATTTALVAEIKRLIGVVGGMALAHQRPLWRWSVQQAEPPPEWPLIKNILAEYGLDAIAFVAEWKAAQRPWVGLTDEDLKLLSAEWRIVYGAWMDDFARDIEAKLKEKNT